MKQLIDHRLLAACVTSSLLLSLPGCERALEVVDQLDDATPGAEQPGSGSPTPPAPPVQNASCACAGSESLLALSCGGGEVPFIGNDIVQTTPDGSVVAFDRCPEDGSLPCDVMRWDGRETRSVAKGSLIGIDDSGERLLVVTGALTLIDVGAGSIDIPMSMLVGRNLLSSTGEFAFGSISVPERVERGERLGRSNAAGDIEVLGDVAGSVGTIYANPAGSAFVGFALAEEVVDDVITGFTYQPFRWSTDGLRFDFPGVPEGVTLWPESVSDDGLVIAGRSLPAQTNFRWSEADGYTELPTAAWTSEAFINADGSVVLGSLEPGDVSGTGAFRWTAETGAEEIAFGTPNVALGMSDDGSVAVAYSWEPEQVDGAPPKHTFVWDTEHGTRKLADLLAERGVDTSGWEFGAPRTLSDDGRVLLGRATCGGVPTLYRVVLSD